MAVDPLRGRNPFTISHIVRSDDAPCPSCGKRCRIGTSVLSDDVFANAVCQECGGKFPLNTAVDDHGDIVLTYAGKPYYPTSEEKEFADIRDGEPSDHVDLALSAAGNAAMHGRPYAAETIYKSLMEGLCIRSGSEDDLLRAATKAIDFYIESREFTKAVTVSEKYGSSAENASPSVRTDFGIMQAMAYHVSGDGDKALRHMKKMLADAPDDDRAGRARINEGIAMMASSRGNEPDSFKSVGTALKDAAALMSDPSPEDVSLYIRITGEYADSSIRNHAEKKGTEAVKNMVKACSALKERYPREYAHALLERSKFLNSMDAVDPRLKQYMDEAIAILSEPDEHGRTDRMLPIAHIYRSSASGKEGFLEIEDLSKAYSAIMDGLIRGCVPDDMVYNVCTTYVQYLDLFDQERSATVREQLAREGFFFPEPPKVQKED